MKDATVEGAGGISIDVSYGYLTNVSAGETCTSGAHKLYIPCGVATVTDCSFTNAAAYSDNTYGDAVVNKTKYTGDQKTHSLNSLFQ